MGNAEFVCPGVRANVIAAGTSGAGLAPPPTAGTKLFNSAILKFLEIFGRESKSVNMLNERL